MERLTALESTQTTGKTKQLFDGIEKKLGKVPNMMRTMGNSPAVLEAYLNLSSALGNGTLGPKLGELLALAVSESNECDYCLSAHAFIGENLVKIDPEAISAARKGESVDQRTAIALKFAKSLVAKRGKVSDEEVQGLKAAGYTEGEIGEIVGHVALNTFTNYFNNTAKTVIDFPVLEAV